MLSTISAKLTGTPDSSGWSQIHEFQPEEPEKVSSRGHLFAVVATKRVDGGGVDMISAGRELIARLHEEYYGDLTQKPFNSLKNAVQKVIDEFKVSWGDVEIAAASLVGGVVYSAAGGGSGVMICRGGALGTILESSAEVVSASGYPNGGDVMLLASKKFFEKVSQGVIKAALTSSTPEEAVEVFGPGVHGVEGVGGLAAIVIQFSDTASSADADIEAEESAIGTPASLGGSIFQNLGTKVSMFLFSIMKNLPRRQIYVKSEVVDEVYSQNKKVTFTVAIVLLILLGVSILFGVRQKKIRDQEAKYESVLISAQKDIDDAISLASVSPDKSRELFVASEQKLAQIESLGGKGPKFNDLKRKIEESRGAVLGEYLSSPELFLDLGLLSSGFKGNTLSFSGGQIFILDKSGKRVVSVAISTKKSKVVAGPTLIDEAFDLASYESRAFILASGGIYEIGATKNKVVDKSWDGDALIKAFAGNLYVLDKSGNTIYRFAGSGSTFGSKQNWLIGSAKVNFSDAAQWVIDGSVYVLFPNSEILKFSLGSPQSFKLSGVAPEIGNIDAIFAAEGNQYVYLLDRAGKRVVVTDKKGAYKAQYIGSAISQATNLVVSEADKKIILLAGDKLLSMEIKHL